MDDPSLAIVQTPQFFRGSPAQSWLENAAGSVQEVFYRAIQVGRDRFGAAACVGTSALYRRAALEAQGGAALIPYAEDVHTGLNVMRDGWSIVYVPLVLSTGICPNRMDAFVRQQYRWCAGNVGIVCSRRLWTVRMSFAARLTFISGFFYYVYTALLVFFGPLLPVDHAGLPAGRDPAAQLRHPAPRLRHRSRPVPPVAPRPLRAVGLAAGDRPGVGARVLALGRRLGQADELASDP